MTTNRKLQSEVDRTYKKVDEGVEAFNEIWDKVHSAPSQSQKEKYELDLKKEIKKLQRMREQIKTWCTSNEFKDTTKLMEYRRLIETKMEEFKVCERETKTKAYSKEGLAAAAKLSPEQLKRRKIRQWVQEKLQEIQYQIEGFEAQIEEMTSGPKKNQNHALIAELEQYIEQHAWHVENLEMTIRALDNDVIDAEQVEDLKDELEYFIESNQEPDFYHDEALYDQLELGEKLASSGKTVSVDVTSLKSSKKDDGPKTPKKEKKSKPDNAKALRKKEKEAQQSAHQQLLLQQQQRQQLLAQQQAAQKAKKEQQRKERAEKEQQMEEQLMREEKYRQQEQLLKKQQEQASLAREQEQEELRKRQAQQQVLEQHQRQQKQAAMEQQKLQHDSQLKAEKSNLKDFDMGLQIPQGQSNKSGSAQQTGQRVPQLARAASVNYSSMAEQLRHQLSVLDASLAHIPTTADSERPKVYVPQRPCTVPQSFPTTPSPLFDNPAIFEKLDLDTLFLIFYSQQGTYQQYLAARELKRKSWRFHMKYLTWFQRHEEPKVTAEDYEIGTYLYFDYENGWCQRIKTDFTFEYPFLEDELQAPPKNKS